MSQDKASFKRYFQLRIQSKKFFEKTKASNMSKPSIALKPSKASNALKPSKASNTSETIKSIKYSKSVKSVKTITKKIR